MHTLTVKDVESACKTEMNDMWGDMISDECRAGNGYCTCCFECMLDENGNYNPKYYLDDDDDD